MSADTRSFWGATSDLMWVEHGMQREHGEARSERLAKLRPQASLLAMPRTLNFEIRSIGSF